MDVVFVWPSSALWWISANICSLAELYSCSRMYTHIFVSALCPPFFCETSPWQTWIVYYHLVFFFLKIQTLSMLTYYHYYLRGFWALHTGCGSCSEDLLLCHRSRCRWPCMCYPEVDSCTVGALPCWAGSSVKLMPCSPGRRHHFYILHFPVTRQQKVNLGFQTTQHKAALSKRRRVRRINNKRGYFQRVTWNLCAEKIRFIARPVVVTLCVSKQVCERLLSLYA